MLRNHYGTILGAWAHHFYPPNVLCAEMEAMIQTLNLAERLHLNNVCFEGDSLGVILALNGMDSQADWRVLDNVDRGRVLLKHHPLWSVVFVNREGNKCAHNLAHWSRSAIFCGSLNLDNLYFVL